MAGKWQISISKDLKKLVISGFLILRIPFDANHNVVGFAKEGEEVLLGKGVYTVGRKSDDNELSTRLMREIRELYFVWSLA